MAVEAEHCFGQCGFREYAAYEEPEPCQGETDGEDYRRAAQDFPYRGGCGTEIVPAERYVGRYAHDEHEERKYQIGRGQSVPVGMHERGVGSVGGIVDEDHAGYRDAAHYVEGEDSLAVAVVGGGHGMGDVMVIGKCGTGPSAGGSRRCPCASRPRCRPRGARG